MSLLRVGARKKRPVHTTTYKQWTSKPNQRQWLESAREKEKEKERERVSDIFCSLFPRALVFSWHAYFCMQSWTLAGLFSPLAGVFSLSEMTFSFLEKSKNKMCLLDRTERIARTRPCVCGWQQQRKLLPSKYFFFFCFCSIYLKACTQMAWLVNGLEGFFCPDDGFAVFFFFFFFSFLKNHFRSPTSVKQYTFA